MSSYVRYNSNGPELLIDMIDQVADVLSTQGGIPASTAAELAIIAVDRFARSRGGCLVYIPKGTWNGGSLTCFQLQERDIQIEREYVGSNRDEICAKYGIRKSRLYQIIVAVRLARRNARIRASR